MCPSVIECDAADGLSEQDGAVQWAVEVQRTMAVPTVLVASIVSVPPSPPLAYVKLACPAPSVVRDPVRPVFGPETTLKATLRPENVDPKAAVAVWLSVVGRSAEAGLRLHETGAQVTVAVQRTVVAPAFAVTSTVSVPAWPLLAYVMPAWPPDVARVADTPVLGPDTTRKSTLPENDEP
jgi:hypothetical protein